MSEQQQRPHVSPTQIDMLCRCGEAYRRRYLEREIIPPGMALTKGKAVHAGAATNFRQKVSTWQDMSADAIVDASVAAFSASLDADGYELTADELARGAAIVIGESKDETARLARAHATTQAGAYQPLLVEEPLRITLDGAHDLFGYVDLVGRDSTTAHQDGPTLVVDFKTTARAKSQADADASTQLTFYAAAVRLLYDREPTVRLDVLVAKPKGVERQVLTATRGAADYKALAHRVQVVEAALAAGVFLPATPGAWWCSAAWCGYHSTCRYVRS